MTSNAAARPLNGPARRALSATLCLAVLDALIDTLGAGKGDLILSGMTDRAQRQETIDFVDYFVAGSQIIAGKDSADVVTGVSSLCGQPVAVHEGSTNGDLVAAQSVLCTSSGRAPVVAIEVPNGGTGKAIVDGRAAAGVDDYPSLRSSWRTPQAPW